MSYAKQRQPRLNRLMYLLLFMLLMTAFTFIIFTSSYDSFSVTSLNRSYIISNFSKNIEANDLLKKNNSDSGAQSQKRELAEEDYADFEFGFKVSQREKGNSEQDCRCKSLFTISDCGGEKKDARASPSNHQFNYVISRLKSTRESGGYSTDLKTLTRYLPQKFIVQNLSRAEHETVGLLTNANGPLPHVGCTEKVYDALTTYQCLIDLKKKRKRPLQIAFVGDSHARFMMAYMMNTLLNVLPLDEESYMKLVVLFQQRIKYDLNVNLPTLNTTLYWSPYPHSPNKSYTSIIDIYCPKDGSTQEARWPDILVISFGSWIANYKETLQGIDHFYADVISYRDCLSKLAEKIPVLWLVAVYPKRFFVDTTNYDHSVLDLLNAAAWHVLKNTGVWMWDTTTLLGFSEQAFCPLQLNRTTPLFDTPVDWNCMDPVHPGKLYNARSVNMIWNLVCNAQLELDEGYCCA